MYSGWIILIVCCTGLLVATIGGLLYTFYKKKFQREEEFATDSKQVKTSPRLPGFFSKRSSEDNHKLEKGKDMENF